MEPETRDLIFELGEADQPKVCIGVCDNSSVRGQIEATIKEELRRGGVEVEEVELSSANVDLLELLLKRKGERTGVVFIVDGLGKMGARALSAFLVNLNFRRDLLFELSVPILLWVTSRVLPVIIAQAPDFWSRRTATYYFTQSTVREILVRLFGEKGVPEVSVDKVSAGVQKILITEAELNKLFRSVGTDSPLDVESLVKTIRDGVATLLEECRAGRRFQVTLTLWNLTRIDEQLYRFVRLAPREAMASVEDLYEDRNEVLLGISELLPELLERYRERLDESVRRRRHVSLLGMFYGSANRRIQNWWRTLEANEGKLEREVFSTQDIWDPDEDQDARFDLDETSEESRRATRVGPQDAEEQFRARAAEELFRWLEHESDQLPRVFSEEEGQLLRIMYEGSFDPTRVARKMNRPVREVRELIEAVRGKVHAFLGVSF